MPVAMGLYLAGSRCCSPPLCRPDNPVWVFISDFRVRFISIFFFFFFIALSLSLSTGSGRQEHPLLLISLSSRFGCFSFSFLSLVSFFFSWASHEQFMMTCICGFHFFSLFSFSTSRVPIQIFGTHSIYREILPCVAVVHSYIPISSHALAPNLFFVIFLFLLSLVPLLLSHPPSLSCLLNRRLIGRWLVLGPAYTHITLAAARSYNNHTVHSLFADFHERGSATFSA
ncbi:hypothetical protein BJ912DRAFT_481489 [Pholiota molesta]|nr:hypothetical protein BJ912DRAFT_481489 [Pholiota molesta]